MNITENRTDSQAHEKKRFSPTSAILGLAVGLGLAGSFYAGHILWTDKETPPPVATTVTAPGLSDKGGKIFDRSNFIADIVAATSPSVVNIDTRTSIALPGVVPFHHFGFDQFFFGEDGTPSAPERRFESRGAGSGVIIREDGYILTNNHVVQQADEIKVTLSDARTFKGKIIGKDKYTDLALIKIPASGLPVAKMASSKDIRPGDWAIAIGSPLGLSQTVTLGIVSALGRSLGDLNAVELIQTDAAINPGNSGGPLLNINGEVMGINQAIRRDGQNISFAIPIDVARDVAEQLMKTGSIAHPYLGIGMLDVDPKVAKLLEIPKDTKGVVISKVEANSPAHVGGLLPRDVIQRINGKIVTSSKEVQTIVRSHKPGEKLDITVLRQTELVNIPVKIGNYEELKSQKD